MRKEPTALRNALILTGTMAGLVLTLALIARYVV
jgi:hypothetical protein